MRVMDVNILIQWDWIHQDRRKPRMPNEQYLMKRAARIAEKYGLSDEDVRAIRCAAWAAYDEISVDLPPDFKKESTCRRSTIIECVLDCGRVMRRLRESDFKMTAGVARLFGPTAPHEDRVDVIGPEFTSDRYEVMGKKEAW